MEIEVGLEAGGVLQGIGLAARRMLGKRGALWWKANRGLLKRIVDSEGLWMRCGGHECGVWICE
jgi:hypothetical protein